MPIFLHRYATPLFTGLFLVSLVSGLALFLHVGQPIFHGMHEWLSLVLIAPFGLHLWKNWRAMTNYLRKPAFALAIALSVVLALPFVLQPATGAGGPPQMALARTLFANKAEDLAPLLGFTPEAVLVSLKEKGFTAAAPGQPLAEIAKASGKSEMELAAALNGLKK